MQPFGNPELQLAFDYVQLTGKNIFLTGKAGTGKTTFLHNLKRESPKRMVVLAPTGVAAINAGGVTIHSFFQMAFGPHIPADSSNRIPQMDGVERADVKRFSREKVNIIKSIDLLVIDEISMSIVRDGEIARDLVITVFEKLLKSVAGSGVRNLKSWLLVVARNECYLYFRKTKHKTISLDSDEVNFASVEGLTVEEATADPLEKERMLDQVVAGLDMMAIR